MGRVNASTKSRDITVVHSGKVALPMIDVEAVVVDGVALELVEIADVGVDTRIVKK